MKGQIMMDEVMKIPKNTRDDKPRKNWEKAFQKWSDEMTNDPYSPFGKCGYGELCDYCDGSEEKDPCIKAFRKMIKEKRKNPDYGSMTFEKAWYGE